MMPNVCQRTRSALSMLSWGRWAIQSGRPWEGEPVEDCMTDASDSSYPTPFLPYENVGELFLQMTNSQIETDSCCPVSSHQVANPIFSRKEAFAIFCKMRRESKNHDKRRDLKHNTLDTVVQNLSRSNLLDCLETH